MREKSRWRSAHPDLTPCWSGGQRPGSSVSPMFSSLAPADPGSSPPLCQVAALAFLVPSDLCRFIWCMLQVFLLVYMLELTFVFMWPCDCALFTRLPARLATCHAHRSSRLPKTCSSPPASSFLSGPCLASLHAQLSPAIHHFPLCPLPPPVGILAPRIHHWFRSLLQ